MSEDLNPPPIDATPQTRIGIAGQAGRGSRTAPSSAARRLSAVKTPRVQTRRAEPDFDDPRSQPAEADDGERTRRDETADPLAGLDLNSLVEELLASIRVGWEQLRATSPRLLKQAPSWVQDLLADPASTLATLASSLGVEWDISVPEIVAWTRERLAGDYAVDAFGFDAEFTERVVLPVLRPLVRSWFRVEVTGVENLPENGAALLVSNHAGSMPLDGLILHAVIHDELGRHTRELGADLVFKTPFSHDFARRIGVTYACQTDAEKLLADGHLVAVFPEGFKGLGKLYADRYRLQRFGRGGFVSTAVRSQVPIIPISIVGSEEIYPLISTAPTLARALGFPYFPITPLFPLLGAIGMIPLPSKWRIHIGEAITTDELDRDAADDPVTIFNITNQVRETIQNTLYAQLAKRRSIFL